ncbi:MAG: GMC oxidoreductase [Oleibacter sp.]|nr:GMC oxidoreductase [Thalassolituus sp.]
MMNKKPSDLLTLSRRRFLGMSALTSASALGLTTISLTSASKAQAGWFDRTALVQPSAPDGIANLYPAIVIGSGYGGAVSALRLGEAGVQTLVIEMGMNWNQEASDGKVFCKMTKPDGRSFWFKDRTEAPLDSMFGIDLVNRKIERYPGVLDRVQHDGVDVFLGRCVGGGSVVNGGMAVTPKRDYFEAILPEVSSDEMYDTYFPRVREMLNVNEVPEDVYASKYYLFSRVGERTAEKAGYKIATVPNVYDFNYMRQEIDGKAEKSGIGAEVIYGNNAAKQSLDRNYIPAAIGTGNVTLRCMTKVTRMQQDANGIYHLSLETIDVTGEVVETLSVSCNQLFLGAGSVGTSELLLRAREIGDLPNLSSEIGQGWGNNGNCMLARKNKFWDYTGGQQSGFPVRGIDNWDDPKYPAFAELAPLPAGIETYTSLYLAITKNPERGYIKYNAESDSATVVWGANQERVGLDIAEGLFDKINKATRTDYRKGLFSNGTHHSDPFTYHPLGGCLLNKVTDNYGRVNGYQNLYITDGSLLPGNVGVNPFLTITALAERNLEHIITHDI